MMNILENRSRRVSCFYIYMHASEHYDFTCVFSDDDEFILLASQWLLATEYIIQENNQVHTFIFLFSRILSKHHYLY